MKKHKRLVVIACALGMMVTNSVFAQTLTTTASSAPKPAVCSVVGEHAFGALGEPVKAIQAFLALRGYTLAQTGEFDVATRAVLKQFQALYKGDIMTVQGLTEAPGIWDIYTAMKARELVCGPSFIPVPVAASVSAVPQAVTTPAQSQIPVVTSALPTTSEPVVCISLDIEPGVKNNADVRNIQRWLLSQGYNKVEASGYYGPATVRAIKHFQTEHAFDILVPAGLTKSAGAWGERTAKKASELGLCAYDEEEDVSAPAATGVSAQVSGGAHLAQSSKRPLVCLQRALESGDEGRDVRTLQKFLRAEGYTKVTATGTYGIYTERAVKHFQETHVSDILTPAGLKKGTGVWGLRTAIKASERGLCDYQ
jgi:peptidoglycan hydrolase-like protein with peptidoglycan-binding domain